MKKILLSFIFFIFCFNGADAAHLYPEKYYQNIWCEKWGGTAEYKLPDKTRVDCLTENYAAEFDFAPKWAEAVGQSLYYSKMTGRKAAIVLIIEKDEDFVYYRRAKLLADDNNIQLWYMKKPDYPVRTAKRNTGGANGLRFNFAFGEFYISFKDIEKLISKAFQVIDNLL